MSSLIALLGAAHSGRHALLLELAPRLRGTALRAEVIEDEAAMRSPALVLLLAPGDAGGEAEDLRWRGRLSQAGIGFSVLHGDAQAKLEGAWRLVQPLLGQTPEQDAGSRWTWSCDKCSDPACEHRLFQDLLQGRRGG